jgi:hypothetical protein
LNWDGILPEVLLVGISLTALFLNPNPYPYNLLHVAPYAFLLAYRYGASLWEKYPNATFASAGLSVILFTHLVPFITATKRHWEPLYQNSGQEHLMNLTEDLTDPEKDTVFDGVGMVPTRKVCDMRTFMHGQLTLNLKHSSAGMNLRSYLEANPPSVVIFSYRSDWLAEDDMNFINQRYVSLSDDFRVLGAQLPAGGGTFEVFHAGRYRITSAEGSNIIGTYPEPKNIHEALQPIKPEPPLTGSVDGVPLNGQPVELSVGTHRIDCGADHKAAVVWVGPRLNEVPRAPGQDRHLLFINWY